MPNLSLRTRRYRRLARPAVLLSCLLSCSPESSEQEPPLELVLANFEEMPITVAVEIEQARETEATGIYVSKRITARVLRAYKGDLSPGDRIEYVRTIERGAADLVHGSRHIASFVRENGALRIPDAGYHFPYSAALDSALAAAAESAGRHR